MNESSPTSSSALAEGLREHSSPVVKSGDALSLSAVYSQPPQPALVQFTIGNTYRRLSSSEASYDKLSGRHLKIHDWSLYVDVLPGSDPDIIEKVTFDMRDSSFMTTAFTCHCPIRIRNPAGLMGKIPTQKSDNQNSSGQSTREDLPTKEEVGMAQLQPPMKTCNNKSRWRFSTRQQTYGPVNVEITIRGRGGCRVTLPYEVKLIEGGNECPISSLSPFVEKRPYQSLKPLKMMDGSFWVQMNFGINLVTTTFQVEREHKNKHETLHGLLYDISKAVYARSKCAIRLILENIHSDDSTLESYRSEYFGLTADPTESQMAWTVRTLNLRKDGDYDNTHTITWAPIFSISSPILTGGHGLNECYKITQGLPPKIVLSDDDSARNVLEKSPSFEGSLIVQIDVKTMTLQQLIKLCQNFVKYEEAIDSFFPWGKRDDRCEDCRSNKNALYNSGAKTNKQMNVRISKCTTIEELVLLMNPNRSFNYKLNIMMLLEPPTERKVEFRQHTSSKDKTVVTHWIRFCTAFVRNSARLRAPLALKATTSIENEFDLMFEYIVKDRALRNYYREKRDRIIEFEERANGQRAGGDMDISRIETDTCKRSLDDVESASVNNYSPEKWGDNQNGKRRCL